MICAWTVTSSAVVGSSAIMRLGSTGEHEGDHGPLPHAARELVRIVVGAALRIGNANLAKHFDRFAPSGAPAGIAVKAQALGDLLPDAHDRIEMACRVLKNHAHATASDSAHFALVQCQ